ncbi:MAG: GntR family transcriptional regulator [Gammaproteobacteria bacterium]|nr:GntR family transcriptional regulator [Gammaproteobacteria bacterium]
MERLGRVSRKSGVTRHHQLYTYLRRALTDGTISPGSALPSEAQLMRQYQVSRNTVRRALGKLEEERHVRSKHWPVRIAGRAVCGADSGSRQACKGNDDAFPAVRIRKHSRSHHPPLASVRRAQSASSSHEQPQRRVLHGEYELRGRKCRGGSQPEPSRRQRSTRGACRNRTDACNGYTGHHCRCGRRADCASSVCAGWVTSPAGGGYRTRLRRRTDRILSALVSAGSISSRAVDSVRAHRIMPILAFDSHSAPLAYVTPKAPCAGRTSQARAGLRKSIS